MSQFVHLHLHTQYSVLDGAIKINEAIQRAVEFGQPAVAITDHGNMHGAMEFYQEAKSAGIKPIIGCEAYFTPGSRTERKPRNQGGAGTYHLTLLAKNKIGYQNLCKLITLGFTEGFYFKPRIDPEILKEFSEGIICLSGCLSSEFAHCVKEKNVEAARNLAHLYQSIFGERYYLEVQPHRLELQQSLNTVAREIGDELGIPLVATNDCHYLNPEDHYAQEVLMCISTGKLITDPDRIRHEGVELSFKSGEAMLAVLPEFEDAIRHSLDIANSCNLEFDFSTYYMPRFTPPSEETLEEHFAREARIGIEERFEQCKKIGKEVTPEMDSLYRLRLDEEIILIQQMGFAGYFLVVSDFIRWAKRNDIPVGPGRGSAAGSLVAYAMFITEIDPIPNNLLFERFLNPERVSLPDIDIDFCIFGRDRVIEYVCNKYGRDKVAQIVTFGTLKAKAVIKDVGRVLGISYAETDRIAKLVPAPRQGFDYPIAEALQMEKRLREYAQGEGREWIALAQRLEGLSRHTSTHAAGLVIADRPVVELLPLMLDKDGQVVTQFSMGWVEKIGLVKFDFLGLKTLTVLHHALRLIEEAGLPKPDLNSLAWDDATSYKLVSAGRTIGVFQLESSGITDMVKRLKPTCFEDLVAILALYRPGPLDAGMADHFINRKHKREPVRFLHPLLEPILKDTYGIILYQEQIMQIARDLAGYSLGEADLLRRAMGKKKPEEMAKQQERFISGTIKNGIDEKIAREVFEQMETFARYGFNRSHSVAYALISYQTAYVKAHFPVYFMAALMTFEMDDTDKTLKNLGECREMDIHVLPPDANRGRTGFGVVDGKILFGLAAIKGVGEKAVEKILQEREAQGPFNSLFDFCQRLDSTIATRRILEGFIKAGAFDWIKIARSELMEQVEDVLKQGLRRRNDNPNQLTLFSHFDKPQDEPSPVRRKMLPEWPTNIRLSHEKEALGFYLSGHPLEKFRKDLERLGSVSIGALQTFSDGREVTVCGVISLLKLKNTKKGDRYATFILEDLRDTIEVIIWPDTYQKVQNVLVAEDPIFVKARLDVSDERRTLVASHIDSALTLRDKAAKEIHLLFDTTSFSSERLEHLKSLFAEHRGQCPVKLILRQPAHSETIVALAENIRVEPSERLSNKIEELFGAPVVAFR